MTNAVRNSDASLARLLQEHPAVAAARVVQSADDPGSTAWIVPDRTTAGMLFRSAVIEDAGRLGPLDWHEPAGALRVAGLNRGETDFLYREIFADSAYLRDGITLPPQAVVVDVGANIGMFALRAARQSPGARIIAVEPVSELAEAIGINAELHDIDVTVLCSAMGNSNGEIDFTFYPHNSVMSGRFADPEADVAVLKGYLLTAPDAQDGKPLDRMVAGRLDAEPRRVPVTTLAKAAAEHGLDRIDLLKIDVEKAEMEVLDGVGDALWPRVGQVVMEVHDIDGRLGAAVAFLQERGFTVRFDQDPRLALTPCFSVYAHRPGADRPTRSSSRPALASRNGPTLHELSRDLRQMIAERHPAATVPQHFAVVTQLTAQTGLPAAPAPPAVPLATRRTAVLAEAWSALFGAGATRAGADFFELGGTSLLALRLLDAVERELGDGALTAEQIFTAGTFGELAALLEAGAPDHRTESTVV
jgi:FkbM family methyltransferase